MTRFLIVDDYTSKAIWDDFLLRAMLGLKSKPMHWEDCPQNTLPEGNWTMANGMHPMASDGAYARFGVRKPAYEELPVVFAVKSDGSVEEQCQVTADQAAAFVSERI